MNTKAEIFTAAGPVTLTQEAYSQALKQGIDPAELASECAAKLPETPKAGSVKTLTLVIGGIEFVILATSLLDGGTSYVTLNVIRSVATATLTARMLSGSVRKVLALLFAAAPAQQHDEHEALLKKWKEEDPVYERIAKEGMQAFYDALPDKEKAFFSKEILERAHRVCACCSDEGIRKREKGKERAELIRKPGSTILLALDRLDKNPFNPLIVDAVAREMVKEKVTEFTSHKGCGAASVVLKARITFLRSVGKLEEADVLEREGVDAFAKRWAIEVVRRMKQLGMKDVEPGFIDALERPAIHTARTIYIQHGRLGLDADYPHLPPGFGEDVIDGELDAGEFGDIKALLGIAFGDHGANELIKAEPKSQQFVLCCIADSEKKLAAMKETMKTFVEKLPKEWQPRIRVEGFLKPEQKSGK